MSLQTLLGLNDQPGLLAGYGPIPAQLARDLATDAVWRCVAVDDTHGTVLGVGRATYTPGYVPGKNLRAFLAVAAPTCVVPWCTAKAGRCDLDHRRPHAAGGATCSCNVAPACRRHHREKSGGHTSITASTDAGAPPGSLDHTSPAGKRSLVLPYAPLPPEAYLVTAAAEPCEASPGAAVADPPPASEIPPPF